MSDDPRGHAHEGRSSRRRHRSRPRPQKSAPPWLSIAGSIVVALLVGFWVGGTRGYYVPSASMEPSLKSGDQFCADVLLAPRKGPRRGEIWVVNNPQPDENGPTLVKRVVGLPGEKVEVREGQVWINDRPLQETYCKEAPEYESPPHRLGPGKYWVLGDNRNDSQDSHVWGPVDREAFIGRAFFRYAPLDRMGAL